MTQIKVEMKSLEEARVQLQRHWYEILGQGQMLQFDQNQYLFYEGQRPMGAFALARGDLQLASGDMKKMLSSTGAITPQIIGLDYLFLDEPYPYSGLAQSKLEVCFLSKSLILGYLSLTLKLKE